MKHTNCHVYSWRWAQKMPETCRVSWQNKILVAWCILLVICMNVITMHGHLNIKCTYNALLLLCYPRLSLNIPSFPDQSMWDLWWTKWHWDRFDSKYCYFLISVSFHQSLFIHSFIHSFISDEWYISWTIDCVKWHTQKIYCHSFTLIFINTM
jgi:hypothetical protein